MKIVVANWKANPVELAEAKSLFMEESISAGRYTNVQTVICPPFVFLEELSSMSMKISLGSQDVSSEGTGPHTGEVPVTMLKALGVSHILVGHSDRRKLGDADEVINKKLKLVLSAGITPILFVGETEKNDSIRSDILIDQISRGLHGLDREQAIKIIPVYEPVWAISTNQESQPDTPESAVEAVKYIKEVLMRMFGISDEEVPPILYGGSINEKNAREFFQRKEISGAVVGGASLNPDEFNTILNIANENS